MAIKNIHKRTSEQASASIAKLVGKTRTLQELTKFGSHAMEGSDLAADDAAYQWEKLSHWAWGYLTASVDHVGLLTDTWSDDVIRIGYIRARATYTLLRGAMEAAAQTVWVLHPADASERRLRHMRLLREDFREQQQVQRNHHPAALPPLTAEQRLADLRTRSAGIASWSQVKKPTSYLGMVRAAAEATEKDPDEFELLWRAASGFAHGKQWPLLAFGTFTTSGVVSEGSASGTLYPNPDNVVWMAEVVVDLCYAGMANYMTRGGLIDYRTLLRYGAGQ